MEHDRYPCASESCPCGAGKVVVDVTTADNGWTTVSGWEGRIECDTCRSFYRFISFGRGVALITVAEAEHRDRLRIAAMEAANDFFRHAELEWVLDLVAASFDTLPTVSAKYRLAIELGLETATLPTFRKHVRDTSMRAWLNCRVPRDSERYRRTLSDLLPLYTFAGMDATRLRACVAQIDALQAEVQLPPRIVMDLGPINLFAAVARR